MSRTYELRCVTCRETIWIGQGQKPAAGEQDLRTIYTTPEDLSDLRAFLFAHEGTHEKHELVFIDDEYGDVDGWHDWDDAFCECERCNKKRGAAPP